MLFVFFILLNMSYKPSRDSKGFPLPLKDSTDPFKLPSSANSYKFWFMKQFAYQFVNDIQVRAAEQLFKEFTLIEDVIVVSPIPFEAWRLINEEDYYGLWKEGYGAVRPWWQGKDRAELKASLEDAIAVKRSEDAAMAMKMRQGKVIAKIVDKSTGMEYLCRAATAADKKAFDEAPAVAEEIKEALKADLG